MKKLNRTITLLFSALIAIPLTGYAESWSCKHDNHLREIQIQHDTSEALPCSVVYKKPTEGIEEQTLWSASSDANYCEEKARALVEKHIGWGWTCDEANAEPGTEISNENKATPESSTSAEASNAGTETPTNSDSSATTTTAAPTPESMPEQH
jgi:hypothetical protein